MAESFVVSHTFPQKIARASMKTLLVCGAILLSSMTSLAQKTRAAQELSGYAKPGVSYPISLHVYGVHLREDCSDEGCTHPLFADVVSSGHKLELGCPSTIRKRHGITLSLGDFKARIVGNGSGSNFGVEYELLLPDKPKDRVIQCSVSGMME